MSGRVISYLPDPDSHLPIFIDWGLGQFSICLRDSNSDNDGKVRRDNTPAHWSIGGRADATRLQLAVITVLEQ